MTDRLTKYIPSADFPPREIWDDNDACSKWYQKVFCAVPIKKADPTMTAHEKYLYRITAAQYISERRQGKISCEEYASALVKRARYYRYMNHWTYRTYDLLDQAIVTARELDQKAKTEGIQAIAPLYGLMVPMKGTAAVIQYPSGAGVGVLSGYVPVKDSDMVMLIKKNNGIIFGTTNVPEFAFSYRTCNPASGQTRNPYSHNFIVGGSSGGAASAVASYMCPIAISEDTGGSTRVPATCNQNFGFDPSRNHYPNAGNPGLSYFADQIGLNARSIDDIILFDRLLFTNEYEDLHNAVQQTVANRNKTSIKIGCPLRPFVIGEKLEINSDVRKKYESTKKAIQAAGYQVLDAEWPMNNEKNVIEEQIYGKILINGKKYRTSGSSIFWSSLAQMSQFVYEYLDAPVSTKEIIADMGKVGTHNPGKTFQVQLNHDETQFRYTIGPFIKKWVKIYNSYFDANDVDLILIPSANAATPDLTTVTTSQVPLTPVGGALGDVKGCQNQIFSCINNRIKFLHIPKMVIPTGLTEDGRPCAIQLWGRAMPYEKMFDDKFSIEWDIEFLYLVRRISNAIQDVPELKRTDAKAFVQPLFNTPCVESMTYKKRKINK